MGESLHGEVTREELIDQFWDTIPGTWGRVRVHLHITARDQFDVTEEQWHILRHIRKGFHSVSQLAEAKHITRSAASQCVDGLVEKGLVERLPNPDDRRYVDLYLTNRGEELVAGIFHETREWIEGLLVDMTPEQMGKIVEGLILLKQVFLETE